MRLEELIVTQLPPDVIPNIFFQLLIQYWWALGIAILVICIYYSYNEQDEQPNKKKSKYPDFEMDLKQP